MGICPVLINGCGKFAFLDAENSKLLKLQNAFALTGPSERVIQAASQHLFPEFPSKIQLHAGLPGSAEGMDISSHHRKDICQPCIVKANSVLLKDSVLGAVFLPQRHT